MGTSKSRNSRFLVPWAKRSVLVFDVSIDIDRWFLATDVKIGVLWPSLFPSPEVSLDTVRNLVIAHPGYFCNAHHSLSLEAVHPLPRVAPTHLHSTEHRDPLQLDRSPRLSMSPHQSRHSRYDSVVHPHVHDAANRLPRLHSSESHHTVVEEYAAARAIATAPRTRFAGADDDPAPIGCG